MKLAPAAKNTFFRNAMFDVGGRDALHIDVTEMSVGIRVQPDTLNGPDEACEKLSDCRACWTWAARTEAV